MEEAVGFGFDIGGGVGLVAAEGVAFLGGGEGFGVVAGAIVEGRGGEVEVGVVVGDAFGEDLGDEVEGGFFGFEAWGEAAEEAGEGGGDVAAGEEGLSDLPGGFHVAGGFEDPGAGFEDGEVVGV